MKSATQAFEAISAHGMANADDSTICITPEMLEKTSYIPQGDINIWPLREMPEGVLNAKPDRQLAPGATRGSRHCIASQNMGDVEFFRLPSPNALQGPVLRFNAPVRIEHPEHGDQVWPAGLYFISYQRRYAEELRRIQD